jgi:hypothetical protein
LPDDFFVLGREERGDLDGVGQGLLLAVPPDGSGFARAAAPRSRHCWRDGAQRPHVGVEQLLAIDWGPMT